MSHPAKVQTISLEWFAFLDTHVLFERYVKGIPVSETQRPTLHLRRI